jgi:hypothetical protein
MNTADPKKGAPPKPPHGRSLGIVGVSLTKARLPKGTEEVLGQVRDQLEDLLLRTDYLTGAPFSWITISIRFGLKDDLEPLIGRINQKYGDLPLSIEMDFSSLKGNTIEAHKAAYFRAAARALLGAVNLHNLPESARQALTAHLSPA